MDKNLIVTLLSAVMRGISIPEVLTLLVYTVPLPWPLPLLLHMRGPYPSLKDS